MLSTHVLEDNGQRIGLDLEPRHSSIAPPPSHLAARVPAIGPGHRLRKFLEGQFAVDVGEAFGVADAGEDWSALRHAGLERRPGLRAQPSLDLPPAALVAPAIEPLQRRSEGWRKSAMWYGMRCRASGLGLLVAMSSRS